MRNRILFLSAGIALMAAPTAGADVIPFSQMREVSSFAQISPANGDDGLFQSDQVTSPDSGRFDETSESQVVDQGTYAEAHVLQTSDIGPDLIDATGSFQAEAVLDVNRTFAEAFGFCKLDYQFDVDAATPYTLTGRLEAAGNGSAYVSLIRNGGPIIVYQYAQPGELPIFTQGTLDPGHYDFAVWTSGYGQGLSPDESNPASGSFRMTLSFSEPAGLPAASGPVALRLWPNPVRSGSALHFTRPSAAGTALSVVDASGRTVRRIDIPAGAEAAWDLRDTKGVRVAPGVYFVRSGAEFLGKAIVLD